MNNKYVKISNLESVEGNSAHPGIVVRTMNWYQANTEPEFISWHWKEFSTFMRSTRIIMATYVKRNTCILSMAEVQVYFDLTPIAFNHLPSDAYFLVFQSLHLKHRL